ncbi:sigma-54 dependent transcriptional regulator [Flavitalea sp. BT771]|uniref:sigma-54-dependent transcriptional regulator n=1 Tax=Flavitalea sp. BT771 TaxID=3063329 RepID=UPI0026E25F18|nr:sigma-54 dependent transcriptional regulator [Flavitalea sp. BT771]MDO6431881.1 sigma-54 dependent transcriptional regulator [Flavitalea sp. BT771]MDV6220790.1 sigma-54 dependent transcriptional regulator [Flavitalea sp. BT771]
MHSLPNKSAVRPGSIIIIHQQPKVRSLFRRIISHEGYKVFEASDAGDASAIAIREDIEVVLCDKDVSCPEYLSPERKKTFFPYAEVVPLSLTEATQEDSHLLLSVISRTLEKVQLEKRILQLEECIDQDPEMDYGIGESSAIRDTIAMVKRIAPTDDTVLLQGNTGTGKHLFARAIHAGSARKNNPFITLHCNILTGKALEIELFGCKAGAYPGISKDKIGALEKACKGSLLLADVGHLDKAMQKQLLQALLNNEFIKPGDTQPTPINVRILSTTKQDLLSAVEDGQFEEALFYRLSIFTLRIPSLHERKMDIPLLARRFIKHFARKADKKVKDMNKDFLYHLQRYSWKGNIRELKNVIERAVIMTESDMLSEENLPFEILYFQNDSLDIRSAFDLKNMEKRHLQKVLTYTRGNKVEAARLLNIGLTTLYRKINDSNYSN